MSRVETMEINDSSNAHSHDNGHLRGSTNSSKENSSEKDVFVNHGMSLHVAIVLYIVQAFICYEIQKFAVCTVTCPASLLIMC